MDIHLGDNLLHQYQKTATTVSILILMDIHLGVSVIFSFMIIEFVSILILMDIHLGEPPSVNVNFFSKVSILILMDIHLGEDCF